MKADEGVRRFMGKVYWHRGAIEEAGRYRQDRGGISTERTHDARRTPAIHTPQSFAQFDDSESAVKHDHVDGMSWLLHILRLPPIRMLGLECSETP